MCVLLITRLLRGVGRWARKPVNHTSWVAIVTPTDRPKSVRNCCLIELFCGVVCVVTLPLWHFCWYRDFCHRTGSDLLLFVVKQPIQLNSTNLCWTLDQIHVRNGTGPGEMGRLGFRKTGLTTPVVWLLLHQPPVGTPGVLVENTSSVSPACRKRRLNGAPLYSLRRWYGVKH